MAKEWREHPKLIRRFLPAYPDDLQVLVHDGGPRMTTHRPELIWVHVTGGSGNIFTAKILNQPHQLSSVSLGSVITFIAPEGGEHPLMVTREYLAERNKWVIKPCNKCGLTELFDPPSILMKRLFPDTPPDAQMEAFTAFCGACGGIQVVHQPGMYE